MLQRSDAISPARVWRDELIGTVRLAGPLALTQLGQIAMMTVDLALIGRLGNSAVAAAALAHGVLFTAFMFGLGLVTAVSPLAAQAFGAHKPRLVRRALRVGLWAAVFVGIPLSLLQLRAGDLLIWLGQPPDVAMLAQRYLMGLAWSLTPAWLFIALRGFMSALNRPEPALWITLAAIPANGVLAYLLIFGALGLPPLDVLGAGIATTLVSVGMFAAGIWVCYASAPFKKFQILGHIWRSDWPLFRQLAAIGLPISLTFLLEHGVFAAAALLMGIIGTVALAAHQVALHTAAIVFMVPLGIGMAATVRVGHAVGRRDAGAARRAGFAALALGVVFQAAMAVCVVFWREQIPLLFFGSGADAATLALTSTLLLIGTSFFIADGLQVIANGALRGFNDTRVPLLFAAVSFWVVGFTCAYLLAFRAGLGAVGVWVGLVLGLACYAVLLVTRFARLAHSEYLPSPSQTALAAAHP
ncbi:MAG: MATE family efflux transporter [Xanthobacteraceae bacterium]|nr:MATE family efflux transporter [Xanthobacteraceae bacterium]